MSNGHDDDTQYRMLRSAVGVYPRSGGLVRLTGLERGELLRYLLARDTEYSEPLTCVDSLVLDEDGTALDLVSYLELDAESWLLSDQLSGAALTELANGVAAGLGLSDIEVTDAADEYTALAFEGPDSWRIARKLIDFDISSLVLNAVTELAEPPGGGRGLLARTGMTGEYGYLVIATGGSDMLDFLLSAAGEHGGGLVREQALSRAKAEVRHPLLPEQADGLSVREAGLEWLVSMGRSDEFRGGAEMAADGPRSGLIAALATGGLPERGAKVRAGDENIGHVQVVLPRVGAEDELVLLTAERPFDVPGLGLTTEGSDGTRIGLRTVSSPVIIPVSWSQRLGE